MCVNNISGIYSLKRTASKSIKNEIYRRNIYITIRIIRKREEDQMKTLFITSEQLWQSRQGRSYDERQTTNQATNFFNISHHYNYYYHILKLNACREGKQISELTTLFVEDKTKNKKTRKRIKGY